MAFSYISGHEGISSNGVDDDAARKVTFMPSVQNFEFRNTHYQSIWSSGKGIGTMSRAISYRN
jgi:hypothetical protein